MARPLVLVGELRRLSGVPEVPVAVPATRRYT